MIDLKYIKKDIQVNSKEELLETLGNELIQNNIVKEGFVEALKTREGEFPTGLPVNPGVAIPHTDGKLVNEDRLVFATLKEPVSFNEMGGSEEDLVDVRVVIMLAIGDGQQHLTTLQKLIESIQKEGFIQGLIDSENIEQMKEIIEQNL